MLRSGPSDTFRGGAVICFIWNKKKTAKLKHIVTSRCRGSRRHANNQSFEKEEQLQSFIVGQSMCTGNDVALTGDTISIFWKMLFYNVDIRKSDGDKQQCLLLAINTRICLFVFYLNNKLLKIK